MLKVFTSLIAIYLVSQIVYLTHDAVPTGFPPLLSLFTETYMVGLNKRVSSITK